MSYECQMRDYLPHPCYNFVEHKGWQEKHPTGPVTWDAWCSYCGFKLEDKSWAKGSLAIEGDGRRLAFVTRTLQIGNENFTSPRVVVCSKCAPVISKGHTE